MEIIEIDLNEIYIDDEFNSRDEIQFTQVVDLAKSIKNDGLLQPIILMPYNHGKYKYKVVAGHRRTKAHLILRSENPEFKTIKAIIREDLNEQQARIINLNENLARKNLNILEEALALVPLFNSGLTELQIVEALPSVSRGWVQIRGMLLKLPREIQEEVAIGIVNQTQIRELYTLYYAGMPIESLFEEVRRIKDAKSRNERYKVRKLEKRVKSPAQLKCHRSRGEIFVMIKHLMNHNLFGLHTRCLAWAAGEVSDAELFADVKEYSEGIGVSYSVPVEGLDYTEKV
jgi:ParB family chromosome partitioning protein